MKCCLATNMAMWWCIRTTGVFHNCSFPWKSGSVQFLVGLKWISKQVCQQRMIAENDGRKQKNEQVTIKKVKWREYLKMKAQITKISLPMTAMLTGLPVIPWRCYKWDTEKLIRICFWFLYYSCSIPCGHFDVLRLEKCVLISCLKHCYTSPPQESLNHNWLFFSTGYF